MSLLGNGDRKILDPQLCFDLWVELGTLKKVQLELQRRGIVHHPTGDGFSASGISQAAHFWILEHPRETYPKICEKWGDISWEQFEEWLVLAATRIYYTESRFRKWLKQMGFYENHKYQEIYADRYPLVYPRGD